MVLDKQLATLRQQFGITDATGWSKIRPEWILAVPNVGEATLNHLRLYLANLGITLMNDGTPAKWQSLLGRTRFGNMQVSDADDSETCPFTIVIDTREQLPFTFQGFRRDAKNHRRPLIVPVVYESLGDHHGDYSIKGFEERVSIERKSMNDAHGTFLGWGERRARFEEELEYLAGLECAAVVIECTRGQMISCVQSRGAKSVQENAKSIFRTVMAWEQDYRVPFAFCDDRRTAEVYTFRLLERYFKKQIEAAKHGAAWQARQVSRDQVEKVLAEL